MGIIMWIVIGITLAVIGKAIARARQWTTEPSLLVGIGAAVLGGFLVDIAVRGDSVIHFKGPTLIGAVTATVIVFGLSHLADQWRTTRIHP